MLVWSPCIHIDTCTYARMHSSFLCTHIDIQASIVIMHIQSSQGCHSMCSTHICTYIIIMTWTANVSSYIQCQCSTVFDDQHGNSQHS